MQFKFNPSCLDSAFERAAITDGLIDNPVFEENKPENRMYSYEEVVAAQEAKRKDQIPPGFNGQPAPVRNDHEPVWKSVISDMWKRHQKGIQTYGVPLQPFNGRDPLWDAYEEALDLAVYLRQAIEERDAGKP